MKLPWTTFHLSKIEYPTSKHQKSIWNLLHKEKKPLGSICQPPQTKHKKPTNLKTLKHCVIFQPEKNPRFFSPAWAIFLSLQPSTPAAFVFPASLLLPIFIFFPPGGKSRKKYLPKRKRPTAELRLKGLRRNGAFHFSETSMRKFLNCLGKTKSFLFYFFTNAL